MQKSRRQKEAWVYGSRPDMGANQPQNTQFLTLRDVQELSVGARQEQMFRGLAQIQGQEVPVLVLEVGRLRTVTEFQVQNTVKVYEFLRRNGFFVPDMVRYYVYESKRLRGKSVYRLVLSDITENGRKWMWSHSLKQKKALRKEVWNMQLSREDIVVVHQQVMDIAQKAASCGIEIPTVCYHLLRQKSELRSLEIALLRVTGYLLEEKGQLGRGLADANRKHAEAFIQQLIQLVCQDPQKSRKEKILIQQLKYDF